MCYSAIIPTMKNGYFQMANLFEKVLVNLKEEMLLAVLIVDVTSGLRRHCTKTAKY
jgi:hypothetical protein